VMRQKYVYKPFVVSPLRQGSAQALRSFGKPQDRLRSGQARFDQLRVNGKSPHALPLTPDVI